MAHNVMDIRCPNCNAAVAPGQQVCEWCHQPVIITSFTSVQDMPMPLVNKYAAAYRNMLGRDPDNPALNKSVGLCYLKLGLYDRATEAFGKAMEENFDDSEVYFYAAVCLLKGKMAFLTPRADIDRAEEYLRAALMIEPRGIYHYFLAYLKHDFFERKYLYTSPGWQECLQASLAAGLSYYDVDSFYALLGVAKPPVL